MLLFASEASSQSGTSAFSMPFWGWVAFVAVLVGLLIADLKLIHSDAHVVGAREAGLWSAVWISLGLSFTGLIYVLYGDGGGRASIDYLSGFLIEKSLSVDNLFVFVLIFQYFSVPAKYQHRVLFWGIFGAFVFRGIFIALGAVLLSRFSWVAYIFGAFLVFTAYRLAAHEMDVHPENNPVLKALKRFGRVTQEFHGQQMFTRKEGKLWATPLFAVLIVVETTDIVFAVDSIPAIFGVTKDPFIVFSSNAFALLGLRALYFLLADAVRRFNYLDAGVALILGLVGVKLIVEEAGLVHLPAWVNLLVILGILAGAIWLSIRNQGWDAIKGEIGGTPGEPVDEAEIQDVGEDHRARQR
ncbi:MAG TPA: TerC family protein [Nitriliruptorales bacterium]